MNPWSANKSWHQAVGRKGFVWKEGRLTALICLGLRFSYWNLKGRRADIRAQFPSTKQKHFYACRARCHCTERPSGPRNVNATMLVQTVSCLLNCNVYLSVCNLWTAYFKRICLTIRSCLRWQLRYLFILLSLSSCPFPHSVLTIEKETWKSSAQIHRHLLISSALFHRHHFALLPDFTSPSSLWPFLFSSVLSSAFFIYFFLSSFNFL